MQQHHVDEAIRLFKTSTVDAITAGEVDGMGRAELKEEMERIEKELLRRLPIGYNVSYQALTREFAQQGYSVHALDRCLLALDRREIIAFKGQRKVITRTGV